MSQPAAPETGGAQVETLLRSAGLILAWAAGAGCGWWVYDHSAGDLLQAVLRGAATWFGVLLVWGLGLRVILPLTADAQSPSKGGSEAANNSVTGK